MERVIDSDINKLTNRHIGKLLDRLDAIGISEIAKSDIKREFWFLTEDIKSVIEGTDKARSAEHAERT
jgi:hypothetical protein